MGVGRPGELAGCLARQQDRRHVQAHERGSLPAAFNGTAAERQSLCTSITHPSGTAPDYRRVLRGMVLTAHKTVAMFMRYVHTEDDPVRQAAELVANRRKAIADRQQSGEASA